VSRKPPATRKAGPVGRDDVLAEALGRYHRARDRAARPMYDFTARLAAAPGPQPAEGSSARSAENASAT
jgi:hypothetical protein